MRTSAVILAAGGSTRMGRAKALLELGQGTLLAAHVAALSAVCGQVSVVVGAHREAVEAEARRCGAQVVFNADWQRTGMADSLRLGLEGLSGAVLVTPVDVPPAPLRVLEAVLAVPGGAAVPTCAGRDQHPVRIDAGAARDRLTTGTLRDVVAHAARVEVDWPDGARNMNTPAQWRAWRTAVVSPE